MTKLRCWPGCLAMVESGPFSGRTLVCERLQPHPSPETGPCWTYEGELFTLPPEAWAAEGLPPPVPGHRWAQDSFADRILLPLVPPPGVDDVVTLLCEPVTGDAVYAQPEEVS